jgi:hypothetical protein
MKNTKFLFRQLGTFTAISLFAVFALLTPGCITAPQTDMNDGVLVVTLHDVNGDFKQLSTFSISDTIAVISDNGSDAPVYNSESQAVVNNVTANLSARGFTKVGRSQSPDFVVNVSAIKVLNVETYYPGYWYGYGGYYGGAYWGYPGYSYYYPWSYTYAYVSGSLLIEIIDVKHKNAASHEMTAIWNCLVNGYVTDNINAATVNTYVNKGFNQSPYIQAH